MKKKRTGNIPSHHLIVENGDWSAVIQARKSGVSWNELRTRNGLSALGMAIFEGSALAVETLLEIGSPIQTEKLYDNTYFSPLWSALEKNQPQILDLTLQAGADPNEVHENGSLPIVYASENALIEETLILCKHGAIPNSENVPSALWLWIKNLTPQYITEENRWAFPDSRPVLALLKNGARIHMDDEDGEFASFGMNEIEFARRQWLKHPLKGIDLQNATMTLSLMERNLYSNQLSLSALDNKHRASKDTNYKL